MEPRKIIEKYRADYWLTFWQCEPAFYWAGTIVFCVAIPLALWGSPQLWWWALAGTAMHGARLLGHRFFRPRPRRLP